MQLTEIEIATAVVFLALQIADVWTTIVGMKTGATEANGIVAWLMQKLGKGWVPVKLVVSIGGAYFAWAGGAIWAVWVLCALLAFVVIHNYRIIKKRKARGF